MDKIPILALLSLLMVSLPNTAFAYTTYRLKKEGTIQPNLAVVLENGTAASTEISVNGTTANVTVSCVHMLAPIVNPNFTDGSGTDAYNWTETPSTNIAVEWDSTSENTRFYIQAANVIEEATCYQDFNYSGTTASADLTFNYTVDSWENPPPDTATMKVQLRHPNATVLDVWPHTPTGTESWTWVSVNVTDYFDQMGAYRLILYLYVDTPEAAKLYSLRWDDVGIKIETKGMEYDYVLKAVSDESYDQNIRLDLYDNSNIGRLSNCTIWFYNATTSSVQIQIIDGSISRSTGDWYSLPASEERRIALFAEESSSGSSALYMRLEAVKGNSIIYTCLIKVTVD